MIANIWCAPPEHLCQLAYFLACFRRALLGNLGSVVSRIFFTISFPIFIPEMFICTALTSKRNEIESRTKWHLKDQEILCTKRTQFLKIYQILTEICYKKLGDIKLAKMVGQTGGKLLATIIRETLLLSGDYKSRNVDDTSISVEISFNEQKIESLRPVISVCYDR